MRNSSSDVFCRAEDDGPNNRVSRRGGRRSGDSRSRDAILTAAKRLFSELGYDRTTMRSVASAAGVDQKLVAYFFGSKQALFVAATELPFDPATGISKVLAGDFATIGERLAHFVVDLLEQPDAGSRILGLVRAAASDPKAAAMARDLFTERIWGPASARIPVERADLAVSLVALELIGLAVSRYIIAVEPLASLPPQAVAALVAPTLQRHLSGPPDPTVRGVEQMRVGSRDQHPTP